MEQQNQSTQKTKKTNRPLNKKNLKSDFNEISQFDAEQFHNRTQSNLIFYSPSHDHLHTAQPAQIQQPSTFRSFTPFRELSQSQNNFFSKHKTDDGVGLIKISLNHNNVQMNNINQDIENNQKQFYQNYFQNVQKNGLQELKLKKLVRTFEKKEQQELKRLVQKSTFQQPTLKPNDDSFNNENTFNAYVSQYIIWQLVEQQPDGNRPRMREGGTMVQYRDRLILYGGLSTELINDVHEYHIKRNKWAKIKGKEFSTKPGVGRFGHSTTQNKNNILIHGGQTEYNYRLKQRLCSDELLQLNLENYEWNIIKPRTLPIDHRRNHLTCHVNNLYFVLCGISTQYQYLTDVHVINLDTLLCRSYTFPDVHGLAYATIYPLFKKTTPKQYQLDKHIMRIKNLRFNQEGIYIFGGINSKGKLSNKITIMKLDNRDQIVDWINPEVKGKKPVARFMHSMNYYLPLHVLVIYGGKTYSQSLADLWFLNIRNLEWIDIKIENDLERSRYCHMSAIHDTKLYIFGGLHDDKYASNELFYFELDPTGYFKNRAMNDERQNRYVEALEQKPIDLQESSKNVFFSLIKKGMLNKK